MELNGSYVLIAALVVLALILIIVVWSVVKRSKEGESILDKEDVFDG